MLTLSCPWAQGWTKWWWGLHSFLIMGIPSSVLSSPRPIWDSCACSFSLSYLFSFWLVPRCCMGLSLTAVCGLLIAVASVFRPQALGADFSSCGMPTQQLWLLGSRGQAQQLWCEIFLKQRWIGRRIFTPEPTKPSTCVLMCRSQGNFCYKLCVMRSFPTCMQSVKTGISQVMPWEGVLKCSNY